MGDTFICDMRHYLGIFDPRLEVPEPAVRIAGHMGRIVEAATSRSQAGVDVASPVRCRRRPRNKPCTGRIVMRRLDIPAEIHWACLACDDNGRISGFKDSPWDLSTEELEPGPAIRVLLPEDCYDAVAEIIGLGRSGLKIIRTAEPVKTGLALAATLPEIELLAGEICSEVANLRSGRRRKRLEVAIDLLHAAVY